MPLTNRTNGGAGYVEGVERLGIPDLVISDAGYGVRDSGINGRNESKPEGPDHEQPPELTPGIRRLSFLKFRSGIRLGGVAGHLKLDRASGIASTELSIFFAGI
jgi:hypothetical protein